MKNEKMNYEKVTKAIAILVVFVMAFHLLSPVTFAATHITKEENELPEIVSEEKEVNILEEDVSKRTPNEKHFKLEDGTQMVTMYQTPVHYEKDGKLEEIDNSLKELEDQGTMALTEVELQEMEQEETKDVLQEKNKENITEENLEVIEKDTKNEALVNNEKGQEKKDDNNNLKTEDKNKQIEQAKEEADEILNSKDKKLKEKKKELNRKEKRVSKVYENNQNSFQTKFVKKTNKNSLGNIKKDNYEIKWSLKQANNVPITILNEEEEKQSKQVLTENEKKVSVDNLNSSVLYKDILDHIDIRYDNLADGVKESIILKNKEAGNIPIVFEYKIGNLKMELNDEKQIIVYDVNKGKENPEFIMDSLFMYDKNIITSGDVEVKLEEKKNKYVLTIIPSKEWLNAEDRVYPVVIDPTINTSLYYQDIQDTFIYDGDQHSPERYRAHIIRVGSNKYLRNPTRGLIKFKLPELKAGDQVTKAVLDICNYPDSNEWTPPSGEIQIDVHKVTSDWNQQTASWSNMNGNYNKKIEDYMLYQYDANNPFKFNYLDITGIAKDWYTTGNNYGLMLKEHNEIYQLNRSDMYFVSANTHVAFQNGRPMVQIVYRNQKGLVEYMTYHSQSVGRAGTGNTNDYNGNLVFLHDDMSTPGNRLPIAINHVFNTNNKDEDIGFGKGFRLNLSQALVKETIQNVEYFKYIDEDGTNNYLKKNGNIYKDEDGRDYIAEKVNNDMILKDKEGNRLKFVPVGDGTKYWFLSEIEDTNNNKITITLDGRNNPTKVTDAAGAVLNLTYQNSRLSSISDTNNRSVQYTYNGSGNLTEITYTDGQKSRYTYQNNLLRTAKNIDGAYIQYDYYPEKTSRVKEIREHGTDGSLGNKLDIRYGNNATIFQDNKGYKQTYSFNNVGQTMNIADLGKNANINEAYGKRYKYKDKENNKTKLALESKMIAVGNMQNNMIKNNKFNEGTSNWMLYETTGDDYVQRLDNSNVFKFYGEVHRRKGMQQIIKTEGKKGDIFTFGGWYKTEGVPKEGRRSVAAIIEIKGKNNETQWIDIDCNLDSNEWQFLSDEFIAEHDYMMISVYLVCYYNANNTFYSNVGLFKEQFGQSYKYDDKGNVESSKDLSESDTKYKFDGNNNLISSVTPKEAVYEYEYDFEHKNQLKTAKNQSGQNYNFEYDRFGNTIESTIKQSMEGDAPKNNETYRIRMSNSRNFFDIINSSVDRGTNLLGYSITDKDNQKFKLLEKEDGYFTIQPVHSASNNQVIDLDMSTSNIVQYTNHEADNQKWKFLQNDDGSYRIISKAKGEEYCVAIQKDKENNIALEKWEGKENQKVILYNTNKDHEVQNDFLLETGEVYYIKLKNSGLYLEQTKDERKADIIQSEFKEKNRNQLWRVEKNDNGTFKIVNLASAGGNVLDVWSAVNAENQKILMYNSFYPNKAQEWRIIWSSNKSYRIVTTIDGATRFLGIEHDARDVGAKATLRTNYGTNVDIAFEKANMSEIEDGATYKIQASRSKLYMTSSQNVLTQEQSTTDTNQQWVLKNLKNGYYKICLKTDENLVLDLKNYVANNSDSSVYIEKQTGEMPKESQQFEIVPNGNNAYKIKSRVMRGANGLDISKDSMDAGANIITYTSHFNANQLFHFEKVESNSDNQKQYIKGNAEHTEDGRYQIKQIDQGGKETKSVYHENVGTLAKLIDANGKETNYSYDNLDRVTKVEKQAGNILFSNEYTYQNDRIDTVKHNNFFYHLVYDTFGNRKQVKVGNQVLIDNEYESGNGNLKSATYGNNQKVSYEYDRFDRITKKIQGNGNFEYSYDAKSNLSQLKDQVNNETETYTYDLGERLVKQSNTNGYGAEYEYDADSNINQIKNILNNTNNVIKYNYDSDNKLSSIKVDEDKLLLYNYDKLSRLQNTTLQANGSSYKTEYKYKNSNEQNRTTTIVESIKNGNNETLNYTYDNLGNIETIKKGNTLLAKYEYDELNQLVRENNKELNKTITYEYDAGGNILNKKEFEYTDGNLPNNPYKTINYEYNNTNWKDQLTSYEGKAITYDEIGNPLTYDNNIYTWQNGRQLAKIQKGNDTIEYKYNADGVRTEKIFNGIRTKYYLNESKVIYEKTGNDTIYYTYDGKGQLVGLKYNNEQYYYIKNIQNDIIGLLNNDLEQLASYTYDSWGKVISVKDKNGNEITDQNNIAHINPYRYRSYRYDKETKLYYLQSRYYNPEWGRFINADGLVSTGQGLLSHNMYIYCENNPINRFDETGMFFNSILKFFTNVVTFLYKNSTIQSKSTFTAETTTIDTRQVKVRTGTRTNTVSSVPNKLITLNINNSNNNKTNLSATIRNKNVEAEIAANSISLGVIYKEDIYSITLEKEDNDIFVGVNFNQYIDENNNIDYYGNIHINPIDVIIWAASGIATVYMYSQGVPAGTPSLAY